MNDHPALEAYLNLGIWVLVGIFILFLTVRQTIKLRKAKKVIFQQHDALEEAKYQLSIWQALPDLVKHQVYTGDFSQNLELIASYLLKPLDGCAICYLVKTPQGYVYSARLVGDVARQVITKSKELLCNRYLELTGQPIQELVVQEKVTGGSVLVAQDLKPGEAITDYLYTTSVPIDYLGTVVGVLGVFGSLKALGTAPMQKFLVEVLELTAYFTNEYQVNLAKEQGKLVSVLQSMNEGVFLLSNDYKVSFINKTACVFLGCGETMPKTIADILALVKGALPIQELVSGILDGGESRSLKRIFINSYYLGFTFTPVKLDREIIGVGVVMTNDSEEERLNNLREDFTAMMVHELRAPLTIIRGSADMILQNKEKFSPQDVDLFLTQIKNSAWDLLKLVNDLLDSAKIESGKFTVNLAPCNLIDLLKTELENYRAFTESKNIDLLTDFTDNLPTLKLDREKIIQVLNNLLSNAVKFTFKGEITHMADRGFIKVGVRVQGGFVQVFVADNGPGIPNEVKKQLFNKFVQARESAISNESGTGLGLAISKGIVEAHGGKIWVEDNVPKGSVFIFTLPIG